MAKKIKNLEELKKLGYIIQEDKITLTNRLLEEIESRKITASDLSKMTGLHRQLISGIVNGKNKPSVDIALKIAYVLDIKVEDIFSLTDYAWVSTVKTKEDTTLFIDLANLIILDGLERRTAMNENQPLYINKKTKELIYEDKYEEIKETFFGTEIKKRMNEQQLIAEENNKPFRYRSTLAKTKEEVSNDFHEMYIPRYQKLAKIVTPLVNKKVQL